MWKESSPFLFHSKNTPVIFTNTRRHNTDAHGKAITNKYLKKPHINNLILIVFTRILILKSKIHMDFYSNSFINMSNTFMGVNKMAKYAYKHEI